MSTTLKRLCQRWMLWASKLSTLLVDTSRTCHNHHVSLENLNKKQVLFLVDSRLTAGRTTRLLAAIHLCRRIRPLDFDRDLLYNWNGPEFILFFLCLTVLPFFILDIHLYLPSLCGIHALIPFPASWTGV